MTEPAVQVTSEAALARFHAARAFVFDMDGVLYRGNDPLPGFDSLLGVLASTGRSAMLATNNSMATPESYTAKLASMGVAVPPEKILTSGTAMADYLRDTLPEGSGIFLIGMPALGEQIFRLTTLHPVDPDIEAPAAVVVGLDLEFTYAKMHRAMVAIRGGARFVATNADATLPTSGGLQPGAGSVLAGIITATGQRPVVIGKPEPRTLLQAAELMGATPSETVMVGDRLDTDIVAGQRAGMLTALVLTGVSSRADIVSEGIVPDLVFDDIPALERSLLEGSSN